VCVSVCVHTHLCTRESFAEVALAAQVSKDGMGGRWMTRGREGGRTRGSERVWLVRGRDMEDESICGHVSILNPKL
jgi:hypothetical protein